MVREWYRWQSFQYPINWIWRDSSWTNKIQSTRQKWSRFIELLVYSFSKHKCIDIIRPYHHWFHSNNFFYDSFIGIFICFISSCRSMDSRIGTLNTHKTHKKKEGWFTAVCNLFTFHSKRKTYHKPDLVLWLLLLLRCAMLEYSL